MTPILNILTKNWGETYAGTESLKEHYGKYSFLFNDSSLWSNLNYTETSDSY